MNKRERVEAFFRNEETDYVPACFWRHYIPELERGEDVAEAHLKFYRETDLDLVKISSDGFFGWPAKALEDLTDVSALYHIGHVSAEHPFIRGQIERAKKIVQALDGECFTLYTTFCPMSLFRLQVGWDKMMECIRRDPKAVLHACDVIAEDQKKLIEGLLREAGVDGLFYSVQNAELTRFTPEEYREWVRPSDRKILDYANSLSRYNVLHCCGWDADAAGTHNHMESWQDYPAGAVSWAAYVDRLDTAGIRAFFGGMPAWGGFDNRSCGLLYRGTKQEIMEETLRLVAENGRKGYMLGPDCSLPTDVDIEHIKWVVEAARSAPAGRF